MKNKLLSLLLVITLLAVTVSVALPTNNVVKGEDTNLISNGDFANYTSSGITDWRVNVHSDAQGKPSVVANVQFANGETANALKITTTKASTSKSSVTYNKTVKIEKNATYTMSYWVKVKEIKGLSTYMFEPNYKDRNGVAQSNASAAEGQNIYTYKYDNGSTRVCRTDVVHSWKVAETGTELGDANGVSMFITRTGGSTNKVLTPDYPEETRQGEWLQVVHTFTTGNLSEHEADVSYQIHFPSAVDGEIWFANFKMTVQKSGIDDYYTPSVNDSTLGIVSKEVPVISGKTSEITAEAFGENNFDGWYVDGELVATDVKLTFTYDPANPPRYEARFTKADFSIDGSFETGFTNEQLLAESPNVAYKPTDTEGLWTPELFKTSSKDVGNRFFIDSDHSKWGKAYATTEQAHTGNFSIKSTVNSRALGYKISGLNKNVDYILSFYAMTTSSTEDGATVSNVTVTDANTSCIVKNSDNRLAQRTAATGALAQKSVSTTDFRNKWEKITIDFNSKDSTEIIVWVRSEKTGTILYLDNYAIKRRPKEFSPAVNNPDVGYVTPKGITCAVGDEITVTANPINDGKFLGWYIGDELKSESLEYTFTFTEEYSALTAKFEAGRFSLNNPGLELYQNGKALAQLLHTKEITSATTDWTDTLFLQTTQDGEGIYYVESNNGGIYRKATVTNAYAHSGNNSIEFNGLYCYIGRKFTGLEKNTEYTISYYGMVKEAADATFGRAMVSKTGMSMYNADGSHKANEAFLARSGEVYNSVDTWTQDSIRFNSGDNTEVMLWIYHDKLGKVYLDDFSIRYAPKLFKPAVNNGALGSVTPSTNIECIEGDQVTVTAAPYPDAIFEGWYIGDELMSTEAEYTFEFADKFQNLTAVFAGVPGTIPNGGFEYYQNDQVLVNHNPNSTPTTVASAPWSYFDQYGNLACSFAVTNEIVHTGEKAAVLTVPYRYLGMDIEGLQPNTAYMASFWAYVTGADVDPNNSNHDQNPKAVTVASVYRKGQPYLTKNDKNEWVRPAQSLCLGSLDAQVDCYNNWKQVYVMFTTPEDSGDVVLYIGFSGQSAKLYLDDLSIRLAPDMFKPTVNNSSLGSVTPATSVPCDEGDEVTVIATPYPDSIFKGWYIGETLKSTELTYTFQYAKEYQGLIAKFEGVPGTIPNAGFEYFQNGQVLANYNAEATPSHQNNPPWSIDTIYRTDKNVNISTTNALVHSGEKAAVVNTPYRYVGMDINGLQPGTEYMVSFWAHIIGKEPPTADDDQNPKNVSAAMVLRKDQPVLSENKEGKFAVVGTSQRLGELNAQVNCYNEWKKVDVMFTTPEDTGDVTLWISFSGYQAKLYLDDFSIGFGIKASVSAELGGTINTSFNAAPYVLKGSSITVEATPFEGNTFAGWFTSTGTEVSKDASYTFTAEESFALIAKFDGFNKPAADLFAMGGKDGSFENGEVPGWFFSDKQYESTWCSAVVSNSAAYEGNYALEINGRHRNSLLAINGLTPNSDYRLSFYIYQPDTHETAAVDHIAIIGSDFNSFGDATVIFAQTKKVAANSGWNKIDLYFNSGANTSANLVMRYAAETLSNKLDRLYIDNLSLYNYDAASEIANASFDDGKTHWMGGGTVADGVATLNADEAIYQDVKVDAYSAYKVTFKAKGNLTVAAQDLSKSNIGVKNFISSKSYIDVNNTALTEYSFEVYTGVHEALNIVFGAIADGIVIDDLKITKQLGTAGAILEHIDFETERYELSDASLSKGYSIYTATGANDPNVTSGNSSLKFTYDKDTSNIDKILDEAWFSYMPGINNSLKLSLNLKIVEGNKGGAISIMPEYSATYGGDTGFEHLSKTDEWQTISFYFNNTTYATFKTKITALMNNTESDFYIDDIVISVTPPMVLEEKSKVTYCERLYNAVDNEGFEDPISDKDWKTLPSTAQIVKGDALKGSNFLRANAGTHYVASFAVEPGKEYYFAASIRGTAKTVGSIGISLDAEGTEYYANRNGKAASVINFDSSESGWKRSGFKFTADNSGLAYIVIDVTAGAMDVDSVMMFTGDYGYRYDPNDYTVYVPYDFDNLQSPTTVINGGFGEQPYYKQVTKRGKEGA